MKKLFAIAIGLAAAVAASSNAGPAVAAETSAYDFEFPSIDGGPLKFSKWRGKALLVVNTASFCGYTRQYAGLQALWKEYEAKGLVVVGVPSNDFDGQEPESDGAIKKFCEGAFGVTFPMTSKQVVTGAGAHPFYKWASTRIDSNGEPGWNFHKYLFGRDGRFIQAFPSQMTPGSDEVIGWIEKTLNETQPAANAAEN
ncbi:MAG: glutathione peroxidase [Hyphomicrobium sp.]